MAGITTQPRMDAFKRGDVRYNDGNPCSHKHMSDRYTKTGECCECNAIRSAARRRNPRPPAPTVSVDEVGDMSLSQQWQYVEPGCYATAYNGHTLQTRRNPDHGDKRRYISIVDRVPIDTPSWSLSEAKTKAIKAVQRVAAGKAFDKRPTAQAVPYPPGARQPEPDYSPSDPIDNLFSDIHPDAQAADQMQENAEAVPEPAPQLAEQPPCPIETRAPQPAQAVAVLVDQGGRVETAPAGAGGADTMRATFTVEIAGHDMVAALNALQSAADLLRSLGHVECTIDLPTQIRL